MSSPRYETGTFGLPPTLFMPTWPSADQLFNLTGFFNLIDQVVTTQQQLVLSYVTFGTRIAESLLDVHDDWSRARAELQDAAR